MPGPTRISLFSSQIAQEIADLQQCRTSLAAVAPPGRSGRVVLDRFDLLIQRASGVLAEAGRQAERDGQGGWADLKAALLSAATIKKETLAFVQGALLRQSGIDGGTGMIAGRLLDDLTGDTGVDRGVLLSVSDGEFLDHTVSMVRARFPDVTVWNLPVLAHELGHHVAVTLPHADPAQRNASHPIAEYLSGEADTAPAAPRAQELAHLHELFADVYATYVLGAAYPLNLITLRARPDRFDGGTASHPSWTRRVHTVLGALAELGAAGHASAEAYRVLAAEAAGLWDVATGGAAITGEQRARTRGQAGAMVRLLAEHTTARARYGMPDRVYRIAVDPTHEPADPEDDVTVADVLNAVWHWRLANWDTGEWKIDEASRRALGLCQRLKGA